MTSDKTAALSADAPTGVHADQSRRYSTDIMKGALVLPESRVIARILLDDPDIAADTWNHLILTENILQKRSLNTAKTIGRFLRARLQSVSPAVLELIAEGDAELATQASMAATVKHSPVLGDYMDQVVRAQHRRQVDRLEPKHWLGFLDNAESYSDDVRTWSSATRKKLGQVIHQALAQAGYLDDTRNKRLRPVRLRHELRKVLIADEEDHVLQCMEVGAV